MPVLRRFNKDKMGYAPTENEMYQKNRLKRYNVRNQVKKRGGALKRSEDKENKGNKRGGLRRVNLIKGSQRNPVQQKPTRKKPDEPDEPKKPPPKKPPRDNPPRDDEKDRKRTKERWDKMKEVGKYVLGGTAILLAGGVGAYGGYRASTNPQRYGRYQYIPQEHDPPTPPYTRPFSYFTGYSVPSSLSEGGISTPPSRPSSRRPSRSSSRSSSKSSGGWKSSQESIDIPLLPSLPYEPTPIKSPSARKNKKREERETQHEMKINALPDKPLLISVPQMPKQQRTKKSYESTLSKLDKAIEKDSKIKIKRSAGLLPPPAEPFRGFTSSVPRLGIGDPEARRAEVLDQMAVLRSKGLETQANKLASDYARNVRAYKRELTRDVPPEAEAREMKTAFSESYSGMYDVPLGEPPKKGGSFPRMVGGGLKYRKGYPKSSYENTRLLFYNR